MSEFNDYKWYEDDSDLQKNRTSGQPEDAPGTGHTFYKETINKKYKKKKRFKSAMLISALVVVSVLAGVAGTSAVYNSKMMQRAKNVMITPSAKPIDLNTSFSFKQLTDSDRKAMSTIEIAANVGPSVVGISCRSQYTSFFGQIFEQSGSGSGIILTEDGYIATNNHVIEDATAISVITNTGEEYNARIIGTDAKTDLAVIKVEATGLNAAILGDSSTCQVGELAVAIGNPLGQELAGTVTVGVVSAVNRSIESSDGTKVTLLQTDAAINPGNSGGALVNAYGEVIGINSMKFSGDGVEGIGFAIPANDAKPVLADLISDGYVKGRPLIGISVRQISDEIAEVNNLPKGLYVAEVSAGGAADKAGIKKGDVITAVDGKTVSTTQEINEIRDMHKVGDTLVFDVSRDNRLISFNVVLQEDQTSRLAN